jgi:hypothetical protein
LQASDAEGRAVERFDQRGYESLESQGRAQMVAPLFTNVHPEQWKAGLEKLTRSNF